MNLGFWEGKRVFLTGHTGFKGAWLALWLEQLGARVTGYALPPATTPALFEDLAPWPTIVSEFGDLSDQDRLEATLREADPEILIHMAAQALVRASYEAPVQTWIANVGGTARVLEIARSLTELKAVLVVTSDKVYEDPSLDRPYVETDRLGGTDPYSASKASQEMVTSSFALSYLGEAGVRVGSARAGNVLGGGDWAPDRLIPDLMRSIASGEPLRVRSPESTRPWQFVLDPLAGYLEYVRHLFLDLDVPPALNFGPTTKSDSVSSVVTKMASLFDLSPEELWYPDSNATWPERRSLELNASQAETTLGWRARLDLDTTLAWTADWYKARLSGAEMRSFSLGQIDRFTAR